MSWYHERMGGPTHSVWWSIPAVSAAYLAISLAGGRLGLAQIALVSVALLLAFWNPTTRRLFLEATPFFVFLVGYDLVRYPRAAFVSSDRVLGCELRQLELALFPASPTQTWPDFFQVHHAPWFDLVAAAPYFAFVYVVAIYSGFLYFHDRPRMRRFLWAFAIGNYLSFAFWLALPAAPPWYIHAYGCLIDANSAPSPAGLGRVDTLLGMNYFHALYSQSSAVFGAMPSMHCSFPMMGLLTAWKHVTWKTRPLHLAYVALMAVAAVYLNHHWVVDVIAGWFVAAISVIAASWLTNTSLFRRSDQATTISTTVGVTP